MTDHESSGRNRLKEALKLSDQVYLEKNSPTEEEIVYSEKYSKCMNRLLRRMQSPVRRFFIKPARRVAGIAVALMIFIGSLTVVAEGNVLHWFSEFYESHVKIYFEDDDIQKAPSTLETIYMPTYIPENYTTKTVYHNSLNTIFQIQWTAENGDYISFNQSILDGEETLDIEETEYCEVYHGEMTYLYIKKYGLIQYIWNTNEYMFNLTIDKNYSEEENWKIIDSIQPYKNTENEV